MMLLRPPKNLLLETTTVSSNPVVAEPESVAFDSGDVVCCFLDDSKKKKTYLLSSVPANLSELQGPEDLQRYNLDVLKKIAKQANVCLPKQPSRSVCLEKIAEALFETEERYVCLSGGTGA